MIYFHDRRGSKHKISLNKESGSVIMTSRFKSAADTEGAGASDV